MKFKNEDDFLAHTFHKDEEMIVNAIELQNRLVSSNSKDLEIARLKREILELSTRNNFLYTKLQEEKNKHDCVYSLDLSA